MGIKISAMTSSAGAQLTDYYPIVQSGSNYKQTLQQTLDLFGGYLHSQGGNSFGALSEIGTLDSNEISILTNGVEKVRIDTNGKFGLNNNMPSGTFDVYGIGISNAYAMKISYGGTPVLFAKNNGEIDMNGFTIRQIGSASYLKPNGTGGIIINDWNDVNNIGKISTTGQLLFGKGFISDANYADVGIATVAAQLTSDVTKQVFAVFTKKNTNKDGLYFSSSQGKVYIQPYSEGGSDDQTLILGGRTGGSPTEDILIKANGVMSMPNIPVTNAGLASGNLYFDTAANIFANGDYLMARKS